MPAPILVELVANVSEFKARLGQAQHEIHKLKTGAEADMARFQAVGKAAFLGFSAAAISVGAIAVREAIKGQDAHAKLAQAVANTGGSMQQLDAVVQAHRQTMEHLGFSQAQYEDALATGTTALGSASKAQAEMNLAMDLARYKNVDLSDAMVGVAKASEGNLRALKQMGIDLPVVAGGAVKAASAHAALEKAVRSAKDVLEKYRDAAQDGTKHHNEYVLALQRVKDAHDKLAQTQQAGQDILQSLTTLVGGQATAHAKTFGGQVDALRAATENLMEGFGNKLIPVIQQVIKWIESASDWMKRHKTTTEALAFAIGTVLVAAIAAYMVKMAQAVYATIAQFASMAGRALAWASTMEVSSARAAAAVRAQAIATEEAAGAATGALDAEAAAASRLSVALGALGMLAAGAVGGYALGKIAAYEIKQSTDPQIEATTHAAELGSNVQLRLHQLNSLGVFKSAAARQYFDQHIRPILNNNAADPSGRGDAQALTALGNFQRHFAPNAPAQLAARRAAAAAAAAVPPPSALPPLPSLPGLGGGGGGGLPLDPMGGGGGGHHAAAHHAAAHHALARHAALHAAHNAHASKTHAHAVLTVNQQILAAVKAATELQKQAVALAELQARIATAQNVDVINGQIANRGSTFAQLAQAAAQPTVNITVHGSVTTQADLIDAVRSGLAATGRRNVSITPNI